MARTDLPENIAEEIRNRVFNESGFMKLTQVVRGRGGTFRVSLRPVVIKDENKYQGEMTEDGRTQEALAKPPATLRLTACLAGRPAG